MEYGDPGFMHYSDEFMGKHCRGNRKRPVLINLNSCPYATMVKSYPNCYRKSAISKIHCRHPRHPVTLTIEQVVLEDL